MPPKAEPKPSIAFSAKEAEFLYTYCKLAMKHMTAEDKEQIGSLLHLDKTAVKNFSSRIKRKLEEYQPREGSGGVAAGYVEATENKKAKASTATAAKGKRGGRKNDGDAKRAGKKRKLDSEDEDEGKKNANGNELQEDEEANAEEEDDI